MRVVNYTSSKKIDDIDLFDTLIVVANGLTLTLPTGVVYERAVSWVLSEGTSTVGGLSMAANELAVLSRGNQLTKVVSQGLQLGTTSTTAYRGDLGDSAYQHSIQPHADADGASYAYNHSQALHAPTDAQKNSDITKAEIEAKLTGVITSHSHAGGGGTLTTWYEPMVVEGENGPEILFSEGDIVMVEVDV